MTVTATPAFLAGDWGTSAFRLWALDRGGNVLGIRRSGEGMLTLAPDQFPGVLLSHARSLAPAALNDLSPLPVVLCGMVGARQGWREAAYVDVPVALDRLGVNAVKVPAGGLDVRILPGLARRDAERPDVIRSEETQLMGLLLDRPDFTGMVVIPGSHSKWMRVERGRIVDFTTAMTGELYATIARHTIIRHAIGRAEPPDIGDDRHFEAGLAEGMSDGGGFAERIFGLRARSLLFGATDAAIAARLSGFLIGAEVVHAIAHTPPGPVTLVATGRLAGLYSRALTEAGRKVELADAEELVRKGLIHAARRIWPALTREPA